jgi:hypothetical protein
MSHNELFTVIVMYTSTEEDDHAGHEDARINIRMMQDDVEKTPTFIYGCSEAAYFTYSEY